MQLGEDIGLNESMARVRLAARRIVLLALIIATILGGIAASQAVIAEQDTINFYWLLLVLLGLNVVTLLTWLAMMIAGPGRYHTGIIGNALSAALRRWTQHAGGSQRYDYPAALAFTGMNFGGAAGRWILSCVSHGFWSAYLLGGVLLVILQFTARQYDFVWETTLLPDSVFITMTKWLAWLPQVLGLDVPTASQIYESRPGADPALLAEARRAWATLLLASLTMYGLLPRLLLLGLCWIIGRRAMNSAHLELGRPYYVMLRHRLTPVSESLGVVDEDTDPRRNEHTPVPSPGGRLPPEDARWVAVETDPADPWPPAGITEDRDLGLASDRAGQHRALSEIAAADLPVVIAIPLARVADRGLSRIVGQLAGACRTSVWLALLENAQSANLAEAERSARTTDWYTLAARTGIPADHVFHHRGSNGAGPLND